MPAAAMRARGADWGRWRAAWLDGGAVAAGLLAMYLPTLFDLLTGLWARPEYAHGPIILALSLWLLWRGWPALPAGPAGSAWGWPPLAFGLACYVLGRAAQIAPLEIGSFVAVLAALVLLTRGARTLARLWFPVFFLLFMVPLPGPLVASLTLPMKEAVSYVTANGLFWLGYPIARAGVTLQIGPYQLLVADACAGLQTLFTLEALGLFYLNVVRHTAALRNVGLALLIVPISFAANVLRVGALTLVTYYRGDAAGQGFLHGFAGMVLFVSALSLIVAIDAALQWLARRRGGRAA